MSKGQKGWKQLFYVKKWANTLDKEPLNGYNITIEDLEPQYRQFCSYANHSSFRKRVFECWGKLGGDYYKHKGYQKFI